MRPYRPMPKKRNGAGGKYISAVKKNYEVKKKKFKRRQ
jgi:hypothetical protein